jgi:PadR family transcriptional regulator, regulatory protein PadR
MTAGDNGNGSHEQRLVIELRRGIGALVVLSALQSPTYGYSLQQRLVEQGFEIDQGTLYPLLRRLDEQGLLESDWKIDEGRPRKYYRLSAAGAGVLANLTTQWGQLARVVDGMLALRPASHAASDAAAREGSRAKTSSQGEPS